MSKNLAIVILAAGKGTRMKSAKAKVLHEVGGLPMISHVINTVKQLKPGKIVVVVGPGMKDVAEAVKPHKTVIQKSQKGTGDAVKAALEGLKNFKGTDVLVLFGDVPLIHAEDLKRLIAARKKSGISIAAMRPNIPGSYGRVVVNKNGTLKKIVEAKDATAAEKEISLCNAGLMCVNAKKLSGWVGKIKNNNKQKEYYLTDLPAIAAAEKTATSIIEISAQSVHGVNDRIDLALVEALFQRRKRLEFLQSGVTMMDPETVYFSWDTKIASDVTIEPNVVFDEGVKIGKGSTIKSFSHIAGATIGQNVSIGPFARIRPGTEISDKVRIGNFVEVKKSKIGKGAKINHLAYVGDTLMGDETNFSAGAITVNYDGFNKHQTKIGRGVMVGSNANLIAPVKISDGAFIAAGSTVTEDVPANALSIGRERPKLRKGWASNFRKRNAKRGKS